VNKIERSALVAYSSQRMFDLVNDIESYPKFMPGCVGTTVLKQGDNWLEAQIDLSHFGIKQSFSTHNTLDAPHTMAMRLIDGPFKMFKGAWRFQALNEQACKVIFVLEFEVSRGLAALALPKLMEYSASEQVDAICKRAKTIYS